MPDQLYKNPTSGERLLWVELKRRNFLGHHFRRQAPFGRYVFDFYCRQRMKAIEIDGASHQNKLEYDKNREKDIAAFGIQLLRFSENEVIENIDYVLEKLNSALMQSVSLSRQQR